MQYTDITAWAREQTGKENSWKFSDASLLKYVNRRYHTIENQIKDLIAEDYFFNIYQSNLVSWQNEYSLKSSSSTEEWMQKILSVEVKRSDEDEYRTKLSESVIEWFSDDYMQANVSQKNWFYKIQDNSIFIYPTPTNTVTHWYQVKAIITNPDLTITDWESLIYPRHSELRQYHYIISMWVIADIRWIDRKEAERNNAEIRFENEILKMVKALWSRKYTSIEQKLPDLDYYKY